MCTILNNIKVISKFTIYTLNNFEKHLPENYNNLTKTTNRKSLKRPAIDQQSTTSNNDKNDKNDKNKRAFSPPSLKDIQEYIKEKNYNINPQSRQVLLSIDCNTFCYFHPH